MNILRLVIMAVVAVMIVSLTVYLYKKYKKPATTTASVAPKPPGV